MKKILALLLLVMVSVAAFTPCCSGTDDCADEVAPMAQHDQEEDDDDRGCSPFFSCTTCPGFISPATLMAMAVPHKTYPQYFEAEVANTSIPFYSTPWQPPRGC